MLVNPEYVSDLVNFYSTSLFPDWNFDPKSEDMRNLQVRGAAKAFNLLEKYKVALIADEVGMGKTIQSLAVCAALWNQKPNARILIIAPRDEIARNWEREYQTFISQHYRHNDNIVKSVIGCEPIRKMIYCPNLYSLIHEVRLGWGQLYLGKISSFSSLMAGNNSLDRLKDLGIKSLSKAEQLSKTPGVEYNNEIVQLLKKEIVRCSLGEQPFFDLVIIDEAHYLRNRDADSLRVNSAVNFFGDPSATGYTPVAKKVLLLTATPNHSSSRDIKNIVSYFTNRFENSEYKDILEKICIRRLRRLGSKALNKYNYRHEQASQSNFQDEPLSEMFFGLYQHELAKEVNQNRKAGKGISGMMKYLEGVEFLPNEEAKLSTEETNTDDNKGNSADYKKGSDTKMLVDLSKRYQEIFEANPSHPKYEKLVKDLTEGHSGEKAVVFVRRIPSVQEISRRVLEFYDKRLWKNLQTGVLEGLRYEKLDRKAFRRIWGQGALAEENNGGIDDAFEQGKNIPSSRVLNLFKVIKNESPSHTAASNFRLRFNRSKPGVFGLFFSPGENYFDAPYMELKSYRYLVGKEELENYYSSALLARTNRLPDKALEKEIQSRLLNKNPVNELPDVKRESVPTLMTIFWDVFKSDFAIPDSDKEKIVNSYCRFSYAEREAFSNFIEKACLLASEAVVIFFELFRSVQSEEAEHAINQYLRFCGAVKEKLASLKLYKQIIETICHFHLIYSKVFSINNEKDLLDESWDSFNNSQPIYPYSADNSNQKVLRCFNTPFYPDILVATSVLQEGVNLQYFCNSVYHYGMAWTPGDNEQRIGRIDRMFGKIERLLENEHPSTLNIYYPYLKDTVDEEHLGRFAKRKYKEEALIDLGKGFENSPDYAMEENEIGGWSRFLREPDARRICDPFPVTMIEFADIKPKIINRKRIDVEQYYEGVINAIAELSEFHPEAYFLNRGVDKSILIDPTLDDKRKQPVIINLDLDHIGTSFTGSAVYTLTMKTPLSSVLRYRQVKNRIFTSAGSQTPGLKMCLDTSHLGGAYWGIFVKSELPFLLKDIKENPISAEEVQICFRNLVLGADVIEKEVFQNDLTKEELNVQLKRGQVASKHTLRKATRYAFDHSWNNRNGMLIKNVRLDNFISLDMEKKALSANHLNPFVKVHKVNGEWYAEVSIPSVDPHKEELSLLERHLDVFVRKLQWEL